jgi:hypothetical protein
VVHVVAENLIAVLPILARVEDVLVPELIYLSRRRRNDVSAIIAGERIEKSSVVEFHPLRLFRSPTQLFHNFPSHRG